MSKLDRNEVNVKEVTDGLRRPFKCCIPQRPTTGRQKQCQCKPRVATNNRPLSVVLPPPPRFPAKSPFRPRSGESEPASRREAWFSELLTLSALRVPAPGALQRLRWLLGAGSLSVSGGTPRAPREVVSPPQPRFSSKSNFRPRSVELSRPKSAKMKEEVAAPKPAHPVQRPTRVERERTTTPKKPSVIPKRIINEGGSNKSSRPITVNVAQKVPTRTLYTNRAARLPNQEIINEHEDLELQQSELKGGANDLNDKDSISSRHEKLTQLKITWQEKIVEFERIKNELNEKQKSIMAVYADMGKAHKKMLALGHKTKLPSREELQIMNVTNMSPEQLLQLCAGPQPDDSTETTPISIEKLYLMPSNLVNTCEQTLTKNKEIIDLLDSSLSAPEKTKLSKKIKEYAAENEMLFCSFEKVKSEFIINFREIVTQIRKSVNETMNLNLRNEQLICENSELNSQKEDLRKQLHEAECRRSSGVRSRVEELEKQLKEEKVKNNLLRDRLTRATCQSKISSEQVSHMEAALEQAQSSCWALERTVHDLQEQNQKLHKDFSLEFNKFTESIRENTAHLEEIAEAREKLQAEKEDLEKRLSELSAHYNESIKNMKKEMSAKVEKIIETEIKYKHEQEERLKMVDKVEALCAQLLESEIRFKDMCKQLQEKELQLCDAAEYRQELDVTKNKLDIANTEIEKYRDRFVEQSEAIKEIEQNLKESADIEDTLKNDLKMKEEYIVELEKKVDLLEQQRQDGESKINSYEEQLSSLKDHLAQLREDFGEFENLNEMHEMVKQQRANLIEATRQNGELAEALQKKDLELEQHIETVTEQEHIIEQRDDIIKMFSQKEEEHTKIIKLLRNNLEMRTQAEADINRQLSEKNEEIESLTNNLDTRKKQIYELEKVIFTLENQTHKLSAQRKSAQEKIQTLENRLNEYETFYMENKRNIETPAENLDSIIKILEKELIGPMETNSKHIESLFLGQKHLCGDQTLKMQMHKYQIEQLNKKHDFSESEFDDNIQIKPTVEERSKKVYEDVKCDLDRQKGITNIQAQKWASTQDPGLAVRDTGTIENDSSKIKVNPTRNLHYLTPTNHFRDDKTYKKFTFAAHRL